MDRASSDRSGAQQESSGQNEAESPFPPAHIDTVMSPGSQAFDQPAMDEAGKPGLATSLLIQGKQLKSTFQGSTSAEAAL